MAGLADRAERRSTGVEAVIRGCLSDGNTNAALIAALNSLRSEAAKVRKRRPGDGALADAEIAGSVAALAAQLHAYKPTRPAGCPPLPGPGHLLAAFAAAYDAGRPPS